MDPFSLSKLLLYHVWEFLTKIIFSYKCVLCSAAMKLLIETLFNDPADEVSPHYGYSHLISTQFVDLSLHEVLLYFWSSSYIYSLLPFFCWMDV